jgi:hypothetical protein
VSTKEIQQTEWYRTRPATVQRRIDSHPPTQLYRMRKTGQIVPIYSYAEDHNGECTTCTVLVLEEYNGPLFMERQVFGVAFEDLEPTGRDR